MSLIRVLIAILLLVVLIYIFKKVEKIISTKAIVFCPVLFVVFFYMVNIVTFGSFLDVFQGDTFDFSLCVFLFSIMIIGFYILYIFERIAQSSEDNNITLALVRIGLAAVSSCLYFALIYTAIYRVSNHAAFQGSIGDDLISQFISFLYLSTIIFTVGFSDISPVGDIPRLIVLLEVVLGFITVIYAISSFTYFRESFKVKSPFLLNKKRGKYNKIRYIRRRKPIRRGQ